MRQRRGTPLVADPPHTMTARDRGATEGDDMRRRHGTPLVADPPHTMTARDGGATERDRTRQRHGTRATNTGLKEQWAKASNGRGC
jgi:hypothetical protein